MCGAIVPSGVRYFSFAYEQSVETFHLQLCASLHKIALVSIDMSQWSNESTRVRSIEGNQGLNPQLRVATSSFSWTNFLFKLFPGGDSAFAIDTTYAQQWLYYLDRHWSSVVWKHCKERIQCARNLSHTISENLEIHLPAKSVLAMVLVCFAMKSPREIRFVSKKFDRTNIERRAVRAAAIALLTLLFWRVNKINKTERERLVRSFVKSKAR